MYMPVGHKQARENVCRAIPIGHRRPNPAQGVGVGIQDFLRYLPRPKQRPPPPRCSDFAEGGGQSYGIVLGARSMTCSH